MSIIYEALKKVERKEGGLLLAEENYKIKRKRKPKPILLISIGVAVISLSILGAYVSYLKRKPMKVAVYPYNQRSPLKALGDRERPLRKDVKGNPEATKYYLQGIVYTEEAPLALINGKRVAEGESIDEATLVSISKKGVELEAKGGKISLALE